MVTQFPVQRPLRFTACECEPHESALAFLAKEKPAPFDLTSEDLTALFWFAFDHAPELRKGAMWARCEGDTAIIGWEHNGEGYSDLTLYIVD